MKYNFKHPDTVELLARIQKTGCVSIRNRCTEVRYLAKRERMVKLFEKILNKKSSKKTGNIVFGATEFIKLAEKLNWQFKMTNRNIPDYVMSSPRLLVRYLTVAFEGVRYSDTGNLASDGIHKRASGYLAITIASRTLAEQLAEALGKFGITCKIEVRTPTKKNKNNIHLRLNSTADMIKLLSILKLQNREYVEDAIKGRVLNRMNPESLYNLGKTFKSKVTYHEV